MAFVMNCFISILLLAIGAAGREDSAFTVTNITKPFWSLVLQGRGKDLCDLVPLANKSDYNYKKLTQPTNTALTSLSCVLEYSYKSGEETQVNTGELTVMLRKRNNYYGAPAEQREIKIKNIIVGTDNSSLKEFKFTNSDFWNPWVVIQLEEAVAHDQLTPLVISVNSVKNATKCEVQAWTKKSGYQNKAVSLLFSEIKEGFRIDDNKIYPTYTGPTMELKKYNILAGTPLICWINGYEVLTAFVPATFSVFDKNREALYFIDLAKEMSGIRSLS